MGRRSAILLLRSNKKLLGNSGGLIDCWSQIPQTTRDAIQLTQRMNRRYLWVDSLCLIQDDEVDMKTDIESMNSIYELDTLTIVAANAQKANAGLPGVKSVGSSNKTRSYITGHP